MSQAAINLSAKDRKLASIVQQTSLSGLEVTGEVGN